MNWYQIISYLLTNELRLLLGLYFTAMLMKFSPEKNGLLPAVIGGCFVTALQAASMQAVGVLSAELLIIAAIAWYYLREQLQLCLFLVFFYEVGVGLWDFMLSAGLGVLFRSENFVKTDAVEHLAGIWLVRLLMLGMAAFSVKQRQNSAGAARLVSMIAILGLFGTVTLSQQKLLLLDEDQTDSWIILSLILLFAVMFFRMRRQNEMELEIVRLKTDQAEILERDYQALRRTYADNARLYHDLHNHIEAIYQCLAQGDIQDAAKYCEDLRTPVREISQTVWTGDKVIDYLVSSKMALAEQKHIKAAVNIEYPHNTNIRSVDLTTILGNLLDNALEAAETASDSFRFLNLTVRRINAMLIIKVENGYGETPRQKDGNLQTSKADKDFHGWGLKSVQTAAERYDGTIDTEYKDGIFKSVVILSFQPVKTE